MQTDLQAAVTAVDAQVPIWNADSDLMRLNRAAVGEWRAVPPDLAQVLALGLKIGRASGGAFDIGMGDAVQAWGFGPEAADPAAIRAAIDRPKRPANEMLELEGSKARKTAPLTLDLNGVTEDHGVDRLGEVLRARYHRCVGRDRRRDALNG